MKLEFIKTCGACPEQYDVFDENDNQVAYIRLRWGYLSVEYDGKEIYSHTFSDDMKGSFDNEEERQKYLSIIRKKIGWKEKVTNFLNNPGKDFVTKEEYDKIMKKGHTEIEIASYTSNLNFITDELLKRLEEINTENEQSFNDCSILGVDRLGTLYSIKDLLIKNRDENLKKVKEEKKTMDEEETKELFIKLTCDTESKDELAEQIWNKMSKKERNSYRKDLEKLE